MRRRILTITALPALILMILMLLGPGTSRAADDVPFPLQVAILLKVLIYDRSLATRAKDGLNLAVVYAPKDPSSVTAKDEFLRAFAEAPRQIAGTDMHTLEVTVGSMDTKLDNADVVYVCTGVPIEKVLAASKKKPFITFALTQTAVESGIVIGLVPRSGKPKLLINVAASISAGMQLDPQILRLAELVRSSDAAPN